MRNKVDSKKIALWILVIITLVGAFIYGKKNAFVDKELIIQQHLPNYTVEAINANKSIYLIRNATDTLYLKADVAIGYGGKMMVGTLLTIEGKVEKVFLLHNTETVSYINKLKKRFFFRQFDLKNAWQPFAIDHDIDAVSGATISSVAITKAVKTSSHYLSENVFDTKPEIIASPFQLANYEWGLFIFFLISIVLTFWLKKRIYKTITLIASVVLLGFVWNASLSVTFFTRILTGEIPSLSEGLLFWIFMFFVIGGIVVFKRNVYCNSICPFFGVQYFITKLTGVKWKLHPKIKQYANRLNGGLLWFALIVALLNNNATMSSYEPFSMMFSMQGDGAQWFIFPFIIIGSMFSSQFFCKYFCPIGVLSTYALKARKGKLFVPKKKSCSTIKPVTKGQNIKFGIVTGLYFFSVIAIFYYLVLNLI